MATRCVLSFEQDDDCKALVYVHNDGQPNKPNGIKNRWKRFLDDLEAVSGNVRWDAELLAARFVVWLALQEKSPITFDGFRIQTKIYQSDLAFIYHVKCKPHLKPRMYCEEVK